MNILSILSSKKFMKLCSKTHQIEPFKTISRGSMPPNPLANAWLCHASHAAPSTKKVAPPC